MGVWFGGVDSRALRAKSKSFTSKVQELYEQGQGTMGWWGSGLVGWILELHEQSPRALQAKSGKHGLVGVWFGGVDSRGKFTSKVHELWEQSPRASQARSGNHGLVRVWFGGVDSRALPAKSKSFASKVQELYKQSQGTMGW